ncbi:SGNH/GDSL hydrolase family protein [Rhodopirellula sallentina]|uniref:O-antigen related protein n=1 Tax=Rhodopirellula sallentina SM41 TaxID=1263870 RepID=M5U8P0_9BACT|nr:GDSL-type esterase/lipase family protein [Rhodopirellula sallentina]EMI52333.1 O-antigen related protein [Rhodopirellula sallentina SM41]
MRFLCLFCLSVALGFNAISTPHSFAETTATTQSWPGSKTSWKGFDRFDFEIDGRSAFVVCPRVAAPGNPWVWRARFPSFHAEADRILLDRGFHVAHIDTRDMFGSDRAMQHWNAFYHFLTDRDLHPKASLEGVSRGGLFVYHFASRWPERVACIYCDTPVCDIRSWPGGKGTGRGDSRSWQRCLDEHGLTEETVSLFDGNPIDNLAPIASAKIPILHIVSLNDEIVPPSENTFILAKRYRELGGKMDMMEVANGTEKSGGHHFPHPDPLRVADFMERNNACLPSNNDYFVLRGTLGNCRAVFENEKRGRVAFLGGSITSMNGWRDLVCEYLRHRFPQTEFDFVDAAIPSTGSTPGAYRLENDVLSHGKVDLLFEEAAVNDLHNMRTPVEMTRGMEGIVRHARRANPQMDIVMLHFVEPRHMINYRNNVVPETIQQHEEVAEHYAVPSIHLAEEVTDRIDAGQFDWENDFVNLHPSTYGHSIYASTIRRMLGTAWESPSALGDSLLKHELSPPIDAFSYDRGKYMPLDSVSDPSGFEIIDECDPRDNEVGGAVREGFVDVPMLVATKPESTFSMKFDGRAVGLFVTAGPDAGMISFRIDDGPEQTRDLFTKWSRGLHIPWAHVLASDLEPGPHRITVRVMQENNESSRGHACRIVHLLVNGS